MFSGGLTPSAVRSHPSSVCRRKCAVCRSQARVPSLWFLSPPAAFLALPVFAHGVVSDWLTGFTVPVK